MKALGLLQHCCTVVHAWSVLLTSRYAVKTSGATGYCFVQAGPRARS